MGKITCARCGIQARKKVLPSYEHEEGIPLKNVEAFVCKKCGEFIFTEKQMKEIEKRTETIRVHRFAFERKLTISGRSLVINLPEDLVRHMRILKGMVARLVPLDDKRFLVEIRSKR